MSLSDYASNAPVGCGSNAPWNEEPNYPTKTTVTIGLCISKEVEVEVEDYRDTSSGYDFTDTDFYKAVDEQVTRPQDLAEKVQKFFDIHPEIIVPKWLQEAINDCKEWIVDDYEVYKD